MQYALRTIRIPDTLAAGYQRGHEVPDDVVASWGLVDGEDVAAERPQDDAPAAPPTRPVDDSDRAAWVAFAIADGADPDEVRDMPLDELMAAYGGDGGGDPAAEIERPADSARKADWVEYVVASGAGRDWAEASDRTKADLQAWSPGDEATTGGVQPETTDAAADQGNAQLGA